MSLGLVATGKRNIKSGSEYNRFFDLGKLEGTDPVVMHEGTNHDTLREMEKIVKKYNNQTKAIAQQIKARSTEATLKNLWSFLYNHVQYKQDSDTVEQLRTPLRTWKDRTSGVDCDCFAIFIGSVLNNLGIPYAFRMAGYSGDFQHVYVVVPKDGKQSSLTTRAKYYVVDPVVNQFNYEVPFTKKFDRSMPIQMLNGFGTAPVCRKASEEFAYYERAQQYKEKGLVLTQEFLNANSIPYTETEIDNSYGFLVGNTLVPAVVTPDQAATLKALSETPVTPEAPTEAKKNGWVWWLLGALGAVILFTDEKEENKKSSSLSGISKEAAKKLRTIHL